MPSNAEIGLCGSCVHCRVVESARGSVFYLCERGLTDPAYPKYPRLPVLACLGWERENPANTPGS